MKRIMALALTLVMLCVAMAAQASEWKEDRTPEAPYSGLPVLDLDEAVGYMMPFPNAALSAENSCQRLLLYLPRTDVKPGDGMLHLCSADGKEVWKTAMNDEEAITQRDISEAELAGLLWGGGTCFEIKLPKTLTLNKSYYVNMSEGCVVSEDGKLKSQAVSGKSMWSFEVTGDYGVSDMEYLRGKETVLTPQEGDTIRCKIELGGDAVAAHLYGYNDTVDFIETEFRETTEVTGEVTAESPVWGVIFLDAYGNELGVVQFR